VNPPWPDNDEETEPGDVDDQLLHVIVLDQVIRTLGSSAMRVRISRLPGSPQQVCARADVLLRPKGQHVTLTIVSPATPQ
jgi:hypothetical protein